MRVEAHPYCDGYLAHAAIAIDMRPMSDAMKASDLSGVTSSIYEWVKDRTVRSMSE